MIKNANHHPSDSLILIINFIITNSNFLTCSAEINLHCGVVTAKPRSEKFKTL